MTEAKARCLLWSCSCLCTQERRRLPGVGGALISARHLSMGAPHPVFEATASGSSARRSCYQHLPSPSPGEESLPSVCLHPHQANRERSHPPQKKNLFLSLPLWLPDPTLPVTLEQSRVLCRGRCPPAWAKQESTERAFCIFLSHKKKACLSKIIVCLLTVSLAVGLHELSASSIFYIQKSLLSTGAVPNNAFTGTQLL